jgi:hypothetical protein
MDTHDSTKKLSDFQREFDRLSVDGFIGDPNGREAYGYVRVSSA